MSLHVVTCHYSTLSAYSRSLPDALTRHSMKFGKGWQLLSANQRWMVTLHVSNESALPIRLHQLPIIESSLALLSVCDRPCIHFVFHMLRSAVVRATSQAFFATNSLSFVKITLWNSLPLFSSPLRAYIGTMSPHHVAPSTPDTESGRHKLQYNMTESAQGDLNNTTSMREVEKLIVKPEFAHRSLAMSSKADDKNAKYRPFLLDDGISENDWVSKLELATVTEMAQRDIAINGQRLRVLVLYGSLRSRYALSLIDAFKSCCGRRQGLCNQRVYPKSSQVLLKITRLRDFPHPLASWMRRASLRPS